MKVLALGPQGSYGHQAAEVVRRGLGFLKAEPIEIEFGNSNTLVAETILKERCLGVLPVENKIEGPVYEIIRDFWAAQEREVPIQVIREIVLPVSHCLLVSQSVRDISEITAVASHQQALGQCRRNLSKLGIERTIQEASTAAAAKKVATGELPRSTSALASSFAGITYALKTLREEMEDRAGNWTRFHLVGPMGHSPTGSDRSALLVWVEDRPGALNEAISPFRDNQINMSRLLSIPIDDGYVFYLEVSCHFGTVEGSEVLDQIRKASRRVLVIGSYPQT